MSQISKLIGALVGSLTPSAVVGYLALFGVNVPTDLVAPILVAATAVLGAIGVYVAPKNAGTDRVTVVPAYTPAVSTAAEHAPGTFEPPYPSEPLTEA